jgi:hypothetical protein
MCVLGGNDLALPAPVMSSARARGELEWRPTIDSVTALRQLLDGMARRAHVESPPLSGDPRLAGRRGTARCGNGCPPAGSILSMVNEAAPRLSHLPWSMGRLPRCFARPGGLRRDPVRVTAIKPVNAGWWFL